MNQPFVFSISRGLDRGDANRWREVYHRNRSRRLHPPDKSRATAVILCAGGSVRMGVPKGLLDVAGVPLLCRHVDRFRAAGLDVLVALGASEAEHRAVLPNGTRVVVNPDWATTSMSDTADLALQNLGIVLLTPVDTPPATADTLRALLDTDGDAVPTWQNEPGHPVRLDPPHPRGRLDLRLRSAARIPVADPDCLLNLNTPAEWARWSGAAP